MTDTRRFILEARGKSKGKKGSGDSARRSRFLSAIMPQLAGDAGKEIANAIEAKDIEKFKSLWGNATNSIISSLEKKFKDGTGEPN